MISLGGASTRARTESETVSDVKNVHLVGLTGLDSKRIAPSRTGVRPRGVHAKKMLPEWRQITHVGLCSSISSLFSILFPLLKLTTFVVVNGDKMVNTAVKGYLIAYNLASFFGWALILSTLIKHLALGPQTASAPIRFSSKLLLALRPLKITLIPSYTATYSPLLAKFLDRGATLHTFAGALVALVQSGAILEVIHAAVGFVKSPVPTTAIQVASRLWLVWGISERFSEAATSPFYASMVFAWSLTECVRYPFYANALMGSENEGLLWAR